MASKKYMDMVEEIKKLQDAKPKHLRAAAISLAVWALGMGALLVLRVTGSQYIESFDNVQLFLGFSIVWLFIAFMWTSVAYDATGRANIPYRLGDLRAEAFAGLDYNKYYITRQSKTVRVDVGPYAFTLDFYSGVVHSRLTDKSYPDGRGAYKAVVRYVTDHEPAT